MYKSKKFVILSLFSIFCKYIPAQNIADSLFNELPICHDSLKAKIYCKLADIYINSAGNNAIVFANKQSNILRNIIRKI